LLITGNVQIDRRQVTRSGDVLIDNKLSQSGFESLCRWPPWGSFRKWTMEHVKDGWQDEGICRDRESRAKTGMESELVIQLGSETAVPG